MKTAQQVLPMKAVHVSTENWVSEFYIGQLA
jgi:hypothetical protein